MKTDAEELERLRQAAKEAIAKIVARKAEIANCLYCKEINERFGGFGPPHFASANCQSGRRNHCSCDTCF